MFNEIVNDGKNKTYHPNKTKDIGVNYHFLGGYLYEMTVFIIVS